MSTEMQNNTQDEQGQPGEDLTSALAGGETDFITADAPKPALNQGLLYLLVLVTIGGGGTYLMYKRQGPSSAAAASVQTVQAQQTINNFLTSGPNGIKTMEAMLQNTEKIVQRFLEYPSVPQVPLADLQTNPFRFSKPDANAKPDEDALRKKKEEERTAANRASQELRLQSIICSSSRKACMINNSLYLEGQQVDQFTVEKITPSGVIVRSGNYGFELRMQK